MECPKCKGLDFIYINEGVGRNSRICLDCDYTEAE